MSDSVRVILDTNVLLRALANPRSSSGQLLQACESRRAIILLSRPLLSEYRVVLSRAARSRPLISAEVIELVLRRLKYVGDYANDVRVRFNYPRDTTDAKIIELAIDQSATHIVSYDADLLSLATSRTDAGKRFRQRLPRVGVMVPERLVKDCSEIFER